MPYMKKFLIIAAAIFFLQFSNAQTDSIGYFGQTPPGDTAVIFAPGIISMNGPSKTYITFTPDGNECYYSVWGANFTTAQIFYTKRVNNVWSAQVEAPFSVGNYVACPFLTSDGNKLYYNSGGTPDIWMVQRTDSEWSDHQALPAPINTTANWDYSYSETTDGRAYIASNRPGGQGAHDIWRIVNIPGQPSQVVNLGPAVNSSATDYCPYVAPDGSYLLFVSERPGGHTFEDIYVTFNKGNDEWTSPINLEKSGARININGGCADPTLSPDGRYLFFSRDGNIYWVNAEIIDKLRNSNFIPYLKSPIPNQADTVGRLLNYQFPDTIFVDDNGNNTLSYSAKQSNGLALPSWLAFDNTTRTFSGTPVTTGIITIKVTATDTANANTSCTFKMRVYPGTTAVEKDKSQLPKESQLLQNYPNPFNPSTTIRYSLAKSSFVRLTIYNVLGQKIRTLQNAFQTAGEHSLVWDATDERDTPVSSGMYFYRLEADNLNMQKKMLIVK
jgi:Putative Ig domain/FlgD Ig-like domain/WD40-like Beta Propeller Repeat